MIEQTEMIVTSWHFHPDNTGNTSAPFSNTTSMDVMRKRNSIKKGLACRLQCHFTNSEGPVLDYVAEHSYVIDLDEVIDRNELLKMFRNSFSGFEEKFDLRKLGTILQNEYLRPLDETVIDVDAILPLLA
ncbi:MAG: hypothetical protein ACKOU7_10525 [Ferruginibacter sp.]